MVLNEHKNVFVNWESEHVQLIDCQWHNFFLMKNEKFRWNRWHVLLLEWFKLWKNTTYATCRRWVGNSLERKRGAKRRFFGMNNLMLQSYVAVRRLDHFGKCFKGIKGFWFHRSFFVYSKIIISSFTLSHWFIQKNYREVGFVFN